MKKTLSLVFLLTSFYAFSQIEGVNPEDLLISTEQDAKVNNLPVQRIKLNTGVELEYVEQGPANGVPVVFLHGLSDSWHSFESTLPHLPSFVRAFALSQRGHGDSEQPANGYSTKEFAADVAAFVRQKGLGAVVIVGHSMGGVNAMQFAVDYPSLTKALVVIDSEPGFSKNTVMLDFDKQVMAMSDGQMDLKFMDEFQKSTLTKPIDSGYYNRLVNEGLKVPMPVFKAALKGIVRSNLFGQLRTMNRPALVVWGEKDDFCGRTAQAAMMKVIRNGKWLMYENTGHALHWEAPERFAKDLGQFIQSLNASNTKSKIKR